MTKTELIVLLKKYKENKARLKLKLREKEGILRKLESIKNVSISSTSYEQNSDIHSKNKISDKVGDKASKNMDIEAELTVKLTEIENEIKELNTKLEEVDIRLEALTKKEREILIDYYIEGNTYEQIGNNTYYRLYGQTRSDKSIQKTIEKATKKMLNL